MKLIYIILNFISLSYLCSCTNSTMLSDSLAKSGSNRAELEKVMKHYSSLPDSLKLKAATFLIANMPGHGALCSKAIYDIEKQICAYPHNIIDTVSLNKLLDSLSN